MAKNPRVTQARKAALLALGRVRKHGAFVRDVLPSILDEAAMDDRDRRFATLLAVGCVQTEGSLDSVLDECMNSPRDVKPDVRDALRISAYEMLFLGKEPYACVNEGVNLAASVNPRVRGLSNAVLRKVAVRVPEFPFGDPNESIEAKALQTGFPVWLAEFLCTEMGQNNAFDFMEISNERPPVFLSCNSLKISADALLDNLKSAGISARRIDTADLPGCIEIEHASDVSADAFAHFVNCGYAIVADIASQIVAFEVARNCRGSLLEIGAGRGTKTLLVQSFYNELHGCQIDTLQCVDNHEYKLDILRDRARTFGARIDSPICMDATAISKAELKDEFDTVFIDSPCTGLGTLRRHPEIRWRVSESDIEEHAKLDLKLLEEAAKCVSHGGKLIYATCTVTNAENEDVIEAFLKTEAGSKFSLSEDRTIRTRLTSGGRDAHFCAVMDYKS